MSAVREIVRDRAEEIAAQIEDMQDAVSKGYALDAKRIAELEADLAELKAFLDTGDNNGKAPD